MLFFSHNVKFSDEVSIYPMNDTDFLNNFAFTQFSRVTPHHVDNSSGAPRHFIGCMRRGRARIVTDGIRLEMSEGDMFYIPKGLKYHSYWAIDGRTAVYDSIGFNYFPSPTPNGYLLQLIPQNDEIRCAYAPFMQDKSVSAASVGRLYTLLGILEEILEKAPADRADSVINHLMILLNRDAERSIGSYAAECGISEAQLYLYVKKKLGKTPNRLRQEIKCRRAAQLLCTTTLSVEEICGQCGFSSASYFRKVFYAVTAKTPSQVRREAKSI